MEKLPASEAFDLAVRDSKSGFVFFNIQGHQYDYDANAQLLGITGGNLLISKEFANAFGRPSDAGATVGKISIGATMQPVEVQTIVNGEIKSMVMPPLRGAASPETPTLVAGPDVIVGCCRKWRNTEAMETSSDWELERLLVTMAISRCTGLRCRKPIIRLSHKISIG